MNESYIDTQVTIEFHYFQCNFLWDPLVEEVAKKGLQSSYFLVVVIIAVDDWLVDRYA